MTPPRKKTVSASSPAAKKAAKKAAPRRRRWKWSDESRAKISASAKETWSNPLVRERRVAGIRRAMKTPEVRARILERSEERRGRKHSPATIRKMRAAALRHRGRKDAVKTTTAKTVRKKTVARKKTAVGKKAVRAVGKKAAARKTAKKGRRTRKA